MSKIQTCKDFVSHPHLVSYGVFSKDDGEFLGIRELGCYQCQMASASEDQGVNQISEELDKLGIPNDIHQTGGFTMCVYIKTGEDSYIYANDEGFSFYDDEECEGLKHHFFDDLGFKTAKQKAKAIQEAMEKDSIKAIALN